MDSDTKDLIHISYNISWEPMGVYSPEIQKELTKAYHEANKKYPDISKLHSWVTRFPDVPQFKNYLITSYSGLGDDKRANELNDRLLEETPDYFFAIINKAAFYLHQKEYDKIPELLGQHMELSFLYPGKETFHISEVVGFNKIAILYFLGKDKIEAAEARLKMLEKIDPDQEAIEELSYKVMIKRMEVGIKRLTKENDAKRKVQYIGQPLIETTEPPAFTHPEIEQLYENDMRIDHDIIRFILALPRKTVIEDLEKVILDSITRFHQFAEQDWDETKNNFPSHAIFLLTELRAEESLPAIFQLLRGDPEMLDYWFGDSRYDFLWECLYYLANNKLPVLLNFLKEPNLDYQSHLVISIAVSQIAIHQPERRAEVVNWYREVFSFFMENIDNDNIIDSDLIGLMVGDVLDFRGKELLPLIGQLFDRQVIPLSISGDFNDVKEEMDTLPKDRYKKKLLTIFDRYDHILETWNFYRDPKDEDGYIDASYEDENDGYDYPETYVREEPKIGRNDPCPCGSGKKYKKCCLN